MSAAADVVSEQEQREAVIKSLLSSLKNTKSSFGADSHQYLQIKEMVEDAIRRLREQGKEDEVARLLQQMSLD